MAAELRCRPHVINWAGNHAGSLAESALWRFQSESLFSSRISNRPACESAVEGALISKRPKKNPGQDLAAESMAERRASVSTWAPLRNIAPRQWEPTSVNGIVSLGMLLHMDE